MNKKILVLLTSLAVSFLFSSCLNFIPELSEEEDIMVVRYMADSVVENDKSYKKRILDEEEIKAELIEEEKRAEQLKAIKEEEEKKKKEEQELNIPDEINVTDEVKSEFSVDELPEILGYSNVDIQYEGYKFTDQMPENAEGIAFVVAPSTPEDTLLVMNFTVTNNSDETIAFNISDKFKIKGVINNKKKVTPLTTFLDGDLNLNFNSNIETNGKFTGVLCFEIPKDENVENLGLILSNGEEKINISLF